MTEKFETAKTFPILAGAVRILTVILAVVIIGWIGAVAISFARRVWAGQPIGIDLLTQIPVTLRDLVVLPIMAGVLLVERMAHGPDHRPLKRLFDRSRYDLFFVLADASGALKA